MQLNTAEVNLEIKVDNRPLVHSRIEAAIDRGLEAVGLAAEGKAKSLCPVDTGRLRNSITHVCPFGEKAVYIGTNVEYARYVEFNDRAHHPTGQAHFLRDAAVNNTGYYRRLIEQSLHTG